MAKGDEGAVVGGILEHAVAAGGDDEAEINGGAGHAGGGVFGFARLGYRRAGGGGLCRRGMQRNLRHGAEGEFVETFGAARGL